MRHRVDDVLVGAAAAEVAAHSMEDLILGGRRVGPEEALCGDDLTRGAIAALEGVVFNKGLLDLTEFLTIQKPFDGGDFGSFGLKRQSQAGVSGTVVDQHRARTALAPLAGRLGAGDAEAFAQHEEQGPPRLDQQPVEPAVDFQRNLDHLLRIGDLGHRFGSTGDTGGDGCRSGAHRSEKATAGDAAFGLFVDWFLLRHERLPGRD